MPDVMIAGKIVKLKDQDAIGKGGEADIFDLGNGQAAKIFKGPTHPDFTGLPEEQKGARIRIDEHQKKLPLFPKNLHSNVVRPIDLVQDKQGRGIIGYTMPLVRGAELLLRYSEKNFRSSGIADETVRKIFLNLHNIVQDTHSKNVVLGDFNDLNVLVKGEEPYMIDADSFQFGGFLCKVFTGRFVDPILCNPLQHNLLLYRPHNENSDWYALSVMLMQSFLFVGPYGGVFAPKNKKDLIPHDQRPLKRITVFNPEVRYPKPARPYSILPDELLDYFHRLFEKDIRGEMPVRLLENMAWTRCSACGAEHARSTCPVCRQAAPAAVKEVTVVRGQVTATMVFQTSGVILQTACQSGDLFWLYHENNEYRREDRSVVLTGPLDAQIRFRMRKKETYFAKGNQIVEINNNGDKRKFDTDCMGVLPVYDVNENHVFWVEGGKLKKDGEWASEYIGDVLPKQTLFWTGKKMGFGFYRAGNIKIAFVFDPSVKGINDSVNISLLPGGIVDTTCYFTDSLAWFFASVEYGGKIINQCQVIDHLGRVVATAQEEKGQDSWLGTIRGKCVIGKFILSPSDDGLIRAEITSDKVVETKRFPDTEPFVDSESYLYPSKDGIFVANNKKIYLLKIS